MPGRNPRLPPVPRRPSSPRCRGSRSSLALGAIAHQSAVKALGGKLPKVPFGHGAVHRLHTGVTLVDSYHCSRYNTNTGRLTPGDVRGGIRRGGRGTAAGCRGGGDCRSQYGNKGTSDDEASGSRDGAYFGGAAAAQGDRSLSLARKRLLAARDGVGQCAQCLHHRHARGRSALRRQLCRGAGDRRGEGPHPDAGVHRRRRSTISGRTRTTCAASGGRRPSPIIGPPTPNWRTVLDIDALGKAEGKSWVWHGADCLEPEQRRCLIALSDGGEDATTVREFDRVTGQFVDGGFVLPHGKQSVAWEDADHLLVAREWTPGDLTTSGYPYHRQAADARRSRWRRRSRCSAAPRPTRYGPAVGVQRRRRPAADAHRPRRRLLPPRDARRRRDGHAPAGACRPRRRRRPRRRARRSSSSTRRGPRAARRCPPGRSPRSTSPPSRRDPATLQADADLGAGPARRARGCRRRRTTSCWSRRSTTSAAARGRSRRRRAAGRKTPLGSADNLAVASARPTPAPTAPSSRRAASSTRRRCRWSMPAPAR